MAARHARQPLLPQSQKQARHGMGRPRPASRAITLCAPEVGRCAHTSTPMTLGTAARAPEAAAQGHCAAARRARQDANLQRLARCCVMQSPPKNERTAHVGAAAQGACSCWPAVETYTRTHATRPSYQLAQHATTQTLSVNPSPAGGRCACSGSSRCCCCGPDMQHAAAGRNSTRSQRAGGPAPALAITTHTHRLEGKHTATTAVAACAHWGCGAARLTPRQTPCAGCRRPRL